MIKKYSAAVVLLFTLLCGVGLGGERVETLTYAVYP